MRCLWWIRLVAIHAQNIPGKRVEVLIFLLELVSVSGDETDKRVPDKQELGVVLQLCLKSSNEYTSTLCHTILIESTSGTKYCMSVSWVGKFSTCNFNDPSDVIVQTDLHFCSWEAV